MAKCPPGTMPGHRGLGCKDASVSHASHQYGYARGGRTRPAQRGGRKMHTGGHSHQMVPKVASHQHIYDRAVNLDQVGGVQVATSTPMHTGPPTPEGGFGTVSPISSNRYATAPDGGSRRRGGSAYVGGNQTKRKRSHKRRDFKGPPHRGRRPRKHSGGSTKPHAHPHTAYHPKWGAIRMDHRQGGRTKPVVRRGRR